MFAAAVAKRQTKTSPTSTNSPAPFRPKPAQERGQRHTIGNLAVFGASSRANGRPIGNERSAARSDEGTARAEPFVSTRTDAAWSGSNQAPVVISTAPEGPTTTNGVRTETQGPAPAPGVFPPNPPPPAPAPAPPKADDHCRTTGSFSSIPSGVLAATMTGTKLGTTFNMVGDFDAAVPCNCSRGEYRQYVRGSFTAGGAAVTHHIGPGLTLHPTKYQLDGNATTANYFGRRDYRTTYSHFEPDQASGCQFQGQDIPGISAGSGTALTVNLDFIGKLIDTGDSNRELASASWSVQGSGTVP